MRNKKAVKKSSSLREAYLQTKYCFTANGADYVLEIGKRSADFIALAKDIGATTAAFVTAVNPYSLQLGDLHNNLAMRALREDIGQLGKPNFIAVFEGYGQGADGSWPPEMSYMITGINFEEASKLGRKYGQNAFVWIDTEKGIPELIELADLEGPRVRRRVLPPFKWIRLWCEWGYELIHLQLTPREYLEIIHGSTKKFETNAWNDGENYNLEWNFKNGYLRIDYADGGVAFEGNIDGLDLCLPEPVERKNKPL